MVSQALDNFQLAKNIDEAVYTICLYFYFRVIKCVSNYFLHDEIINEKYILGLFFLLRHYNGQKTCLGYFLKHFHWFLDKYKP